MAPDDDKTGTHAPLTNGTIVSHYRIIEKIGAGGMGEVYLAEDTELNRKVALKFLSPDLCRDADCRARFKREAQAAAKLNHHNIITIFEVSEFNDRPFFAMEYVEGAALDEYIRSRKLSWQEIIDLSVQVAEGLGEAHRAGVIHRDIKPSNILVDTKGRVKILDFGLATIKGERKLTKTGSTLGTLHYMSPEQTRGETLDERSDIFSFGVVFYEMITGQIPFRGEHEPAIMYAIAYEEPEPLARFKSGVSDELQGIVGRMLAKDKVLRYLHTEDMLADLKRERDALFRPSRSVRVGPLPKTRVRLLVSVAIIALVITVAGGIYFGVMIRSKVPLIAKQNQVTFVGDATQCALSPDGTYMAYGRIQGRSGRVLIQDFAGGEPLQVAECAGVRFLHWSPSGTELLMGVSAGDPSYLQYFIVSRLGGSPRQYLAHYRTASGLESAAWSPDGTRFVAHFGVWQRPFMFVDKKSGDESPVTVLTTEGWIMGISWSPGSDRVYFRTETSDGAKYWTMRADGTELKEFPCGDGFAHRWSSKGDAVYYLVSRKASMSLMKQKLDPASGVCDGGPQELLSGLQTSGPITISADGHKLLYPRSDRSSNLWLVITGAHGTIDSVRPLTSGTAQANWPEFSPDGKTLAFSVNEFGEEHIYTMPITGGSRKRLTFTTPVNLAPAWSPDGRKIAFVCWRKDAYRIATVNADGSDVRYFDSTLVTDIAGSHACSWGPGQSILYQRPGNRNFAVLDPEKGSQRLLVPNDTVGWLFAPYLSPNAHTLAVWWNRSLKDQPGNAGREFSGRGIWTMASDGTGQRMLFGSDSIHTPLGWSADGDSVYFYSSEVKDSTYIYVMSASGGALEITARIPLCNVTQIRMSPDRKHFVCRVTDLRSDLWLVEDFDPDVK